MKIFIRYILYICWLFVWLIIFFFAVLIIPNFFYQKAAESMKMSRISDQMVVVNFDVEGKKQKLKGDEYFIPGFKISDIKVAGERIASLIVAIPTFGVGMHLILVDQTYDKLFYITKKEYEDQGRQLKEEDWQRTKIKLNNRTLIGFYYEIKSFLLSLAGFYLTVFFFLLLFFGIKAINKRTKVD